MKNSCTFEYQGMSKLILCFIGKKRKEKKSLFFVLTEEISYFLVFPIYCKTHFPLKISYFWPRCHTNWIKRWLHLSPHEIDFLKGWCVLVTKLKSFVTYISNKKGILLYCKVQCLIKHVYRSVYISVTQV